IHESCNASQKLQLERGLFDMKRLCRTAVDHILEHGNQSAVFTSYFGEGADPAVPLGIFERLLRGDKSDTLIRCDDPDHNCATQEGWNGHWRGENATGETVICPLSFETRLPIEKTCAGGFQLARDNVNIYWGADLLHRAMHFPALTNEHVTHLADEYAALLELAHHSPEEAVRNQHTIQDFAFEVFSRKYITPEGCVGEVAANATDAADAHGSTTTTKAHKECHTHSDGVEHCS
ncbi:zincin, partial [Microstroma glucosiphilum]